MVAMETDLLIKSQYHFENFFEFCIRLAVEIQIARGRRERERERERESVCVCVCVCVCVVWQLHQLESDEKRWWRQDQASGILVRF